MFFFITPLLSSHPFLLKEETASSSLWHEAGKRLTLLTVYLTCAGKTRRESARLEKIVREFQSHQPQ
jgi:hypothetical protein